MGRQSRGRRKWETVIWALGVVVLFMFVYLLYVLINPEKF